jgi:ferritin-like metal-binding protein YciE
MILILNILKFLNKAYSAENTAVERITSRIEETPIPKLQQRLKQHLQ